MWLINFNYKSPYKYKIIHGHQKSNIVFSLACNKTGLSDKRARYVWGKTLVGFVYLHLPVIDVERVQ